MAVDTRSESRITDLRHEKAGGAFFFAVLFHVWGWAGLVVILLSAAMGSVTRAIDVGTWGVTFWIGGMVLLGLSALLSGQRYVARYSGPMSGNPEYPDIRNGYPYRHNPDGTVVVLTADGPRIYKSWKEFWKATQ